MQAFPVVTAKAFQKVLASGSTEPLVLLAEDEHGREGEWVTKLYGGFARRHYDSLNEAICSRLASYFGIKVPEPALVNVENDFVESLSFNPELRARFQNSMGSNFGSRNLGASFWPWPQETRIAQELRDQAAAIFAFDCLIDNGNRTRDNPNLTTDGKDLYVFDHELAFFSLRPGGPTPGWRFAVERRVNHPFFGGLQKRRIDLDYFMSRLRTLDDDAIADLCASLPVEFAVDDDWTAVICDWLRSVRNDTDAFELMVYGVL